MKLLVALTLVLLAASPHARAPQPHTTITGRVVAEATGQPVRRAYVIAHGPDTRTTRVTMSDGEGTFTFEGLPSDRYRVGASKLPHLSAVTDVTGAAVVIRLPAGGVVTGTVVDSIGRPASEVTLNLSGAEVISPRSATTNHQGEYRFFSLPAGEYTVEPVHRKGGPRIVTLGTAEHKQLPPLVVDVEPAPVPGRAQTKGSNVIAGVAIDERTGTPLSNAPVRSRTLGLSTFTDADGRFRFEGLGDGTFQLLIEGAGFQPTSAAEVAVKDGARVLDVRLLGSRVGGIAGVVRDEFGDPIVDMPVSAHQRLVINSQVMMRPRGPVRTDDRGMFDLGSLPAGEYLLCACAGDSLAIDRHLLRHLGPTVPDALALSQLAGPTVQTFTPTFYPGLARASDSPLVVVENGDLRSGMDITMHGVRPFTVSGQLVDATGAPASQMQAFIALDGDMPGAFGLSSMGPVRTAADGLFRFSGVPPGTYWLGALPAATGQRTPWGVVEVTVVDRDIDQLVVPVGNGVTVKGRLQFPGTASAPSGTALEKVRVSLFPHTISTMMFVSLGNSGTIGYGTTVDTHGQFSVDNLPHGPHRVAVTVPGSNWRVQHVVAADGGALDELLEIGALGGDDILVVLTDAPLATLTGTLVVDKERYEAVGFARVTVFPMDAARWLEPAQYPGQFMWTSPRPDGSFRLENMPPGDYYVARTTSFDTDMSPRLLERWSKTAERVTLRAGETTTVNLKR